MATQPRPERGPVVYESGGDGTGTVIAITAAVFIIAALFVFYGSSDMTDVGTVPPAQSTVDNQSQTQPAPKLDVEPAPKN